MDESGPSKLTESDQTDSFLSTSQYLTRQEVMKRRASRLRRLARCYRHHYWLLMEDLRRKHREYIWKYGRDCYEAENGGKIGKLGFGENEDGINRCNFQTCRSKAMALTSYCHSHILSDPKQVLYAKCQFALKWPGVDKHLREKETGTRPRRTMEECHIPSKSCGDDPVLCGKPVLRSTVPPMCANHTKSTKQNIQRALKRNGVSAVVSSKLSSKFHVVLTEYVRKIQNKRRAMRRDNLARNNNTT